MLSRARDFLHPSLDEKAADKKLTSSLSVKETNVSVFSISASCKISLSTPDPLSTVIFLYLSDIIGYRPNIGDQ